MNASITPGTDLQIEELDLLAKAAERQQPETIGQRLRAFAAIAGITQAELAENIGMTQPMISGYEHGTLRPPAN